MNEWLVRIYDDPREYSAAVNGFLMRSEAEYNLLLGILDELVTGLHDYRPPILLATVEHVQTGSVHGCVWRTPPFKLGLTQLPVESLPLVVDTVAEWYPDLDVALAPASVAHPLGELLGSRRGRGYRMGIEHGIYRLEQVVLPDRLPPGRMLSPKEADAPLLVEWLCAFSSETGIPVGDAAARIRRLLDSDHLRVWVWEERIRCMTAAVAFTEHGVRIAFVYTPPGDRGNGYASALVAAFSQKMLDSGRSFCFLYADESNPTSTGIYRRLGYERVAASVDVEFY